MKTAMTMNTTPRPALTDAQDEIVTLIRNAVSTIGVPPSLRELGEALGISAPAVSGHLDRIKAKGYVTWEPGKSRTLRLL